MGTTVLFDENNKDGVAEDSTVDLVCFFWHVNKMRIGRMQE